MMNRKSIEFFILLASPTKARPNRTKLTKPKKTVRLKTLLIDNFYYISSCETSTIYSRYTISGISGLRLSHHHPSIKIIDFISSDFQKEKRRLRIQQDAFNFSCQKEKYTSTDVAPGINFLSLGNSLSCLSFFFFD